MPRLIADIGSGWSGLSDHEFGLDAAGRHPGVTPPPGRFLDTFSPALARPIWIGIFVAVPNLISSVVEATPAGGGADADA